MMVEAYTHVIPAYDCKLFVHVHVRVVLAYWARLAHPFLLTFFCLGTGNSDPVMFDLSEYDLVYDYREDASSNDYPADH